MRKFLMTAPIALLAGCAAMHPETDAKYKSQMSDIEKIPDQVATQSDTSSLVRIHAAYTTGRMVKRGKESKLSPEVRNVVFGLGAAGSYTLEEVARRITERTHIPVRIIHDDLGGSGSGSGGDNGSGAGGLTAGQASAIAYANGLPSSGSSVASASSRGPTIVPDIEEPLPNALDDLADRFDFDWTVDNNGGLVFSTTATEVFAVPLSPQKNLMSATINGATDADGPSAGKTSQDTGFSVTLDPWDSIEKTAQRIIGGHGFATADRATGFLVVRTTPRLMRQLKLWYEPLEQSLLARVAVDITLIYVDITDSTNFGFNLNAAFASLKGPLQGLNVGFAGVVPSIVNTAGSQTIGIVNAPAGTNLAQFNGTSAVVQALAQANRLIDTRTYVAQAMNNTPEIIKQTNSQDYLKNVQFNTTGLSGTSSTSTDVETATSGFSAQVLPKIISKDQIALMISVTNSGVPQFTSEAVNSGTNVQLKNQDQRALNSPLVLASGETEIAASYDYTLTNVNDSGVGQSNFIGLGGSQAGSVRRIRMYLAVHASLIPTGQPYNVAAGAAR